VRFEITEPCDEAWETMEPREGGRYCQACEKVVIDLVEMSRAQAEAKIAAVEGSEVCVQLAVDRFGDALFAPAPSRAPHWAGGLVLIAALTASGCGSSDEPEPCEIAEITPEDPGPPMIPGAAVLPASDAPPTGPVPAAEVALDDSPVPTAAQQRMTQNKRTWGQVTTRPPIQHVRGRMPLHRP